MTDPIETYISELSDIRSSAAAVKETSYYSALSKLMNDIGQKLKPKIRCIINPRNQGAGLPDGGPFSSDQFQKASEKEPAPGTLPSRGAASIERFVANGTALNAIYQPSNSVPEGGAT